MLVAAGITIGGKYTVERPLARGGMGAVWVARHVKLGSPVAVKFLDAHLAAAPALVARFEREARAAANLDTPHVVKVHDYGVEDGTPYLVMELLRGEDLNTRLRRGGRLRLPEAAKILSQMGRALRRAHEAGIVHRDLKPANVFLARIEDEDVVKVLDFGIAKETWSRVDDATKTGEIFGSPHYMSPEQARAQKTVDHRADVWAAGVIVYRMITGKLPFPGEALGEVISSVLVDPFPPIAEVAPELPAGLEGFFSKALAKKKEERFSSIGELVDAFSVIAASGASAHVEPMPTSGSPTAPTLEPASPIAERSIAGVAMNASENGSFLQPSPAPRDPSPTIDTKAPTQVYTRVAVAEQSPNLAAPAAPAIEKTSPTLGSASSTLSPPELAPRRSRAVWVILGAAASAVVVGAWLFVGTSTPSAPGAEVSSTGSTGLSAEGPRAAETASLAVLPATAAVAAPTTSASAKPGPSPDPATTAKPASRPSGATSGATSRSTPSSAVPEKKPPPKKQNPDWGL